MATQKRELCPENKMSSLIARAQTDAANGLRDLEVLLRDYPEDARLHFLKGSLLASQQDFPAAREAMRRAVDVAPDYAVARFQLGFLLLTSGEPHAAQEAWGPLHGLPSDNYMKIFVLGLCHLIRDEFDDTIRLLQDGMARNHENPPMNADMQLIIDEVRRKQIDQGDISGTTSSVGQLLRQSALKATKH
jgi:tetratricopeptide (TPR) repeat protein